MIYLIDLFYSRSYLHLFIQLLFYLLFDLKDSLSSITHPRFVSSWVLVFSLHFVFHFDCSVFWLVLRVLRTRARRSSLFTARTAHAARNAAMRAPLPAYYLLRTRMVATRTTFTRAAPAHFSHSFLLTRTRCVACFFSLSLHMVAFTAAISIILLLHSLCRSHIFSHIHLSLVQALHLEHRSDLESPFLLCLNLHLVELYYDTMCLLLHFISLFSFLFVHSSSFLTSFSGGHFIFVHHTIFHMHGMHFLLTSHTIPMSASPLCILFLCMGYLTPLPHVVHLPLPLTPLPVHSSLTILLSVHYHCWVQEGGCLLPASPHLHTSPHYLPTMPLLSILTLGGLPLIPILSGSTGTTCCLFSAPPACLTCPSLSPPLHLSASRFSPLCTPFPHSAPLLPAQLHRFTAFTFCVLSPFVITHRAFYDFGLSDILLRYRCVSFVRCSFVQFLVRIAMVGFLLHVCFLT